MFVDKYIQLTDKIRESMEFILECFIPETIFVMLSQLRTTLKYADLYLMVEKLKKTFF